MSDALQERQPVLPGVGISLAEKEQMAIALLQTYEPSALTADPANGYYLAFSGGKDSCVIKELATRSGVRFVSHYNVTTIDPPELVRFIKREHPDAVFERPTRSFWTMVEAAGLPTRRRRWCCAFFKEHGGAGKTKITGVRWAESPRRKSLWKQVSRWTEKGNVASWMINPILYWSDVDVWEYIRTRALPYCELYDQGFARLGCVGCPLDYRRADTLRRYPRYLANLKRAYSRFWESHCPAEITADSPYTYRTFASADDYFEWWISNKSMPDDEDCQLGLF